LLPNDCCCGAAALLQELSPLGSRLLAGIPRTSRWHVLALLQPVVLAPGQQLCWAGQPAEHIWLMQVRPHGICDA
jgi:hypothetical protein